MIDTPDKKVTPFLVTIETIAEMLSVSRTTAYKLVRQGMPVYRLNTSLRANEQEVKDWLKDRRKSA